ncbi:PASTA domain-containing penicillin-binding protein [Aneurinibacillus tyrosinisolvens]|uniref:PASTA domain-containing penicillin-binding protein n=1 Tax=Aneurinibacillus tyrosinisolvens TaxID=1443435 RepID=UPI00063F9040|nr:PASTA domain-containing penicillin-binding protein [Aneurinibacillus tyrosinisolvens]
MKKKVSTRTLLLALIFTGCFLLLISKLWWIQVMKTDYLVKAKDTWEKSSVIYPNRGTIIDRNGNRLAYNMKAFTVVARLKPYQQDSRNDNYVHDVTETAAKLAPVLHMPVSDLITRLQRNAKQVELRPGGWKISKEVADKIMALKLPGVGVYPDTRRLYPNGTFVSDLLGFVNLDGKAQMGIELTQDKLLRGKEGKFVLRTDKHGKPLPDGIESYKPAVDGDTIKLTIDSQIQSYVENALNESLAKYTAHAVSVIVTNPNTGEVLAIGNRPSFNPNTPTGIKNFTNLAVGMNFEPGSTFKIATLAAAIEEKKFNANEKYLSGIYRGVKGPPIRDHNEGRGWGYITFREGVKRSSNVAFVLLGYDKLGEAKLFSYLQDFGFGKKTGIELPGEEKGSFDPYRKYYPRDVASITFGQGISVTPIQQAAAVGAIANGGILMKPYVIKEIIKPKTNTIVKEKHPQIVRRVVSKDTTKQVRDLLSAVVNEKSGTGQQFALPNYEVAGKTGTAQKYKNGRYAANKYISSFIGFAPKDRPKVLVYVVVDEPSVGGKIISSSIFKSVMEQTLRYLHVVPISTKEIIKDSPDTFLLTPKLYGVDATQAKKLSIQAGLSPQILGEGKKVLNQYPKPGTHLMKGNSVYLLTSNIGCKMPDLTGKTLKSVLGIASLLDIKVSAEGEGFVTKQNISSGKIVKKGAGLTVTLHPKSTEEGE